MFDIVM